MIKDDKSGYLVASHELTSASLWLASLALLWSFRLFLKVSLSHDMIGQ